MTAGERPGSAARGAALQALGELAGRLLGTAPARVSLRSQDAASDLPPPDADVLSVPLTGPGGEVVGDLWVAASAPRSWTEDDVLLLSQLAVPAAAELELAALGADYADRQVVWQLALDAAQIGTFDWDLRSDRLVWDDRLLELFGLDRDSFGGSIAAFNASVHPEDLPRVTAALAGAIESCGHYDAEYRVELPDGEVRWIAARGRALAGPAGTAVRVLGAAYDTTPVQEGEARVARVLEAMPSAFFQLDRQWRFRYVNARAERLLGRSREELVGGLIWELFPDAVDSDFERRYRRVAATGEPEAFDAYYPPPLDAWYDVRAWPSPDGLSVYFVDVTARYAAQARAEATAERNALLAGVTAELTGTLDAEEAVGRLAPLVVPSLADWCVVTTVLSDAPGDWRDRLRDVGWWHADPELRPVVDRYAQLRIGALTDESFVARALTAQQPVVVASDAARKVGAVLVPGEAHDIFERLDPFAAVVVQLRSRDRTLGLLTVFRGPGRVPFAPDELETLTEVAARAGLALDNARLFAEQRDLAEGLQRSLLTPPPETDRLEVVVRYEPAAVAAQVGGDWYDAFHQREGGTVVVIGDVVGHDTAAAAAMGQVRGLLRGIAVHSGEGPAAVLRGVDEVMTTLQVDTTATAVVARLEVAEELSDGPTLLRWSNAGHPPPVLIGPDGAVRLLDGGSPDLLLGLDPATDRVEQSVALAPGSTLLLYTDGLIERREQSLDAGLDHLVRVVADLASADASLQHLCDRLLERLLPERPEDDVAVVAVRLDAPALPEGGVRSDLVCPPVQQGKPAALASREAAMTSDPVAWSLDRELSAPAHARQLVASLCARWRPEVDPRAWETALLLVTELVTNAVRYGRAPLQLSVLVGDDVLRVEVSDHEPRHPVVGPPADVWSEGGRGLLLVDAMSASWGVTSLPDGGKSVWFELPVEPGRSGDPGGSVP
jgi:serine phosphatase RsbU (regulator of sigma subunit)/PAS domain-containing protein/anti-sigma regulatory factor (Ser/Thr protein kinase)